MYIFFIQVLRLLYIFWEFFSVSQLLQNALAESANCAGERLQLREHTHQMCVSVSMCVCVAWMSCVGVAAAVG